MKPSLLFSATLLAALSTGAPAGLFSLFDPIEANEEDAVYFKTQAFIADDVVSIHDLFHKWHGRFHPKGGDNLALDDARGDIGMSKKGWGYVGYAYRHQAFTRASRDLALLTWQQLNHKDFTLGKEYDLDLAIKGYETDGIVFAKSLTLTDTATQRLTVGIGFSLLHGYNMQDGYLKGTARAESRKEYSFQAVSDYRYTRNYLYRLDVDDADGDGFTTHLSLDYRYGRIRCHLLVNDLYGRITWHDLPYSFVELNSDNKSYDDNGYIVYKPTVKGVELYRDYTQKLYKKVRLEAGYGWDEATELHIGADNVRGEWFPYGGMHRRFGDDLAAGVSYDTRYGMVGVDIFYKTFSLTLKSNDIEDPWAMAFSFGYRYLF